MKKTIEVLEVFKCPSCKKSHKYGIGVMRSSFFYGASSTTAEKQVRRLLTCPTTGEDFEMLITLQDDHTNKIVSVSVEGLIEEKQ